MSKTIPFNQRFGTDLPQRPLDKEVPESARIGLINLLEKLIDQGYISYWPVLTREALLTARRLRSDFQKQNDQDICIVVIKELPWDRFYIFCEKAFQVLQPKGHWNQGEQDYIETGTLEESQGYFSDEINELMAEEHLAYELVDGIFQRRGRPQLQKSLQRVGAVLADPRYVQVRSHYNKAVKFFNERPTPDVQNCIKEAVCALEAFTEILFGKKSAKNFDELIRSKEGNTEGQIAPTIGESIIKLRAFRGNAQGVAHAALDGGFVSEVEAELVLSLVASYITYLYDRFPVKEEELPF